MYVDVKSKLDNLMTPRCWFCEYMFEITKKYNHANKIIFDFTNSNNCTFSSEEVILNNQSLFPHYLFPYGQFIQFKNESNLPDYYIISFCENKNRNYSLVNNYLKKYNYVEVKKYNISCYSWADDAYIINHWFYTNQFYNNKDQLAIYFKNK